MYYCYAPLLNSKLNDLDRKVKKDIDLIWNDWKWNNYKETEQSM